MFCRNIIPDISHHYQILGQIFFFILADIKFLSFIFLVFSQAEKNSDMNNIVNKSLKSFNKFPQFSLH